MILQGIISDDSLQESNGEWYDCYILKIEDNGVQSNPNIFREYEKILPHHLVEENPEKYLDYKATLKLPWQEEETRKGGSSSSDDQDKLQNEVDELKALVEKQSKLLEELTNSKK